MNKLFITQSLDGYIANDNEELDWLYEIDGENDNGYAKFYNSIDNLIIGKKHLIG